MIGTVRGVDGGSVFRPVACRFGADSGLGPSVRDASSSIDIVAAVCGRWRLSVGMTRICDGTG